MLSLLLLSACSNVQPIKIVSDELPTPSDCPSLPDPNPINLAPVHWVVLTKDRLPIGGDWVYFSLSSKDYENLSLNQAELLRWIEEASWRLRHYRGEPQVDKE